MKKDVSLMLAINNSYQASITDTPSLLELWQTSQHAMPAATAQAALMLKLRLATELCDLWHIHMCTYRHLLLHCCLTLIPGYVAVTDIC